MTAAWPGVIAQFMANRHYGSHQEYINALAEAMSHRVPGHCRQAGLVLQLDCPDLASWPVYEARGTVSKQDFLAMVTEHIEGINSATAGIPPEWMRMHVCWGNAEGPHNHGHPADRDHRPRAGGPAGGSVRGGQSPART